MKITKKQPLRPRGRSEEKRQSTKNAIRDAYINGPQKEVQIIPAKRDMEPEAEKKKLRVCAYCRVSTDEDTQASSYELQVQNYTRLLYYGLAHLHLSQDEVWLMPFGLLLDLWECHKQYNGQAIPAHEHYIDDIIPDGI